MPNEANSSQINIKLKVNQKQPISQQETQRAPADPHKHDDTPKERLKNTTHMIFVGLIISLSALMHGYSIKEITSVPIKKLMLEYDIQIDSFAAQSILIGILPIGSIFGAIITKFLNLRFRRLAAIHIITAFNIGAIVLVNITNFGTLIAGRFIEGICIGYYTAIAPLYLKEIAPKQLRKVLGLFFSVGKAFGVLIVIILELSFEAAGVELGWRVILSMTAGFSLLQAILVFFFCPNTPYEMIEKQKHEEAKKIIAELYMEEYVQQVYAEYEKEHETELAKGTDHLHHDHNIKSSDPKKTKKTQERKKAYLDQNNSQQIVLVCNRVEQVQVNADEVQSTSSQSSQKELSYQQKKNYAYCLAIHLCLIRHWIGGNAIISQGGLFISTFDATLGKYTSIIINTIQFIFIIFGLVYVQKHFGKRSLFIFSITLLSLLDIGVAIAMIHKQVLVCEMLLCIFMVVYGASYIAPMWAYPSEIIPANQALLPNIVHWLSLATSTLIPPIVSKAMPDNNPYPVFLFFGLYGLFSLIHIIPILRESDGLTYTEIIKSFK